MKIFSKSAACALITVINVTTAANATASDQSSASTHSSASAHYLAIIITVFIFNDLMKTVQRTILLSIHLLVKSL